MIDSENQDAVSALVRDIERGWRDLYPDLPPSHRGIRLRSLEIRRWSFLLRLEWAGEPESSRSMIVKIPKAKRGETRIRSALNDLRSIEQGRREYDTLRMLWRHHSSAETLEIVRPLGYLEAWNAIVTEAYPGRLLYESCRDTLRGSPPPRQPIGTILFRCGRWLADYQNERDPGSAAAPNADAFRGEMENYRESLASFPTLRTSLDSLFDRCLDTYAGDLRFSPDMLDGFEIRNVLVTPGGRCATFDLSRRPGFFLSDVARFCLSVELLFWGTWRFPVGPRVRLREYANAFLAGYRSARGAPQPLVDLFLLKEWLRQHALARISIEETSRPGVWKRAVRRFYIDRHFERGIGEVVQRMSIDDRERYRRSTRALYRDEDVALKYKEAYRGRFSLRNLRAKVIAVREQRIIRKALAAIPLGNGLLLDVPCGTGKAREVLPDGQRVIAADVSLEMIRLGREDYGRHRGFCGFIQADATMLPFPAGVFSCVLNLRLLHRVPGSIKKEIVEELARASAQYVVLSFTVDTVVQRFRRRARGLFLPHDPAMSPIDPSEMREILHAAGLRTKRTYLVLPLLSAERIVVLEKN